MTKRKTRPTAKTKHVAIYCRQSVANDVEYGSIDAQREAVESFIASQRGEGWVARPERYDDHGFSGGNTDRPGYQRLIADVEAGEIDVIAAYKVDRISRSLPDFTSFMAMLEQHGVGFVSITQNFDTLTSLGRLTLNMLASFSQFERDTISERTRDKIVATRRTGRWTGGRQVLGYDVVGKRLVINEDEAEIVRAIFECYLHHGGLVATVGELARRGVRNKTWINQRGNTVHGTAFEKNTLRSLLTNPLYIGKIRCDGEIVHGRHDAVVEESMFEQVALALRERQRAFRGPGKWDSLLGGLLRCARCNAAMSLSTNVRGKRTYRYYLCQTASKSGASACPGSRAPATELEEVVVSRIGAIGQDPSVLLASIMAAAKAGDARKPGLTAEARRINTERTRLARERRNLLDALQQGEAATGSITGRIAEVDEQIRILNVRHAEVKEQLAAIENTTVDEDALREALRLFTPVWDELQPRERARVLRLLIAEVRFDGQAGEVEIDFRENGIRGLVHEVTDRRSA